MNRPPLSALRRLALLGGLAALLPAAHATQLVHQNLKQMIAAADVIVSGDVAKVGDGIDHGLPFTEVTLKVKESVKRDMALNSSYKFRQYGLLKTRKMGDGRYMLPAKIEGMASWKVGEKVTIFMNKPALRTGLVTPVGLAQGKFTSSGSKLANGFNNRDLFKGMTVDPSVLNANEAAMLANQSGGAVEGGVLNHFVKRAISEQWIEKGVMR
ncbi:hypothetical protein [Pelomonas sp. Root1217]|uniref:hypothetical protein n=1 Tax=Pelomonas sp. Root1217 TaxID=1736430 RepID=UPI0012F7B560|nr:hypothetical protein [Pelomonas sp. Root1217]